MSFEFALKLTETLLAIAFIQQSIEHLSAAKDEKVLFTLKLVLSTGILFGLFPKWLLILLFINSLFILKRFRGPYNGGSDRMGLLILSSLCLIYFMPSSLWQQYVFAYLAMQLILSYFLSGVFKVINPDWWSGKVLKGILEFSEFPAHESLRRFAIMPRLLLFASWTVVLFELAFPMVLLSKIALIIVLGLAMVFHLVNTYVFGFNRFFWTWLAAYPSLIWFQEYFMARF